MLPDIDECDLGLNACHENATCTNTIGSHVCSCKAGYVGDGVRRCITMQEASTQKFVQKSGTQERKKEKSDSSGPIIGVLIGKCLILYLNPIFFRAPLN